MNRSSIGRKLVMAGTGLGLLGFVILHLAGNLQIFAGPEALNTYAAALADLGGLLWVARAGLAALLVLHVATALRVAADNRAARPVSYEQAGNVQKTVAARSMVPTGLVILAFVAYHLAHFTLGLTHPEHWELTDALGRHDVYSMVVLGFQQPVVAGAYILAMVLLGLHLLHGNASVVRTLGIDHPRFTPLLERLGRLLAAALALGNIAIPVAVWMGMIGLPEGVS